MLGATPAEAAMQVPGIVYYKQALKPIDTMHPIDATALAPTVLELAGLTVPKGMEGASLEPLLAGESAEWSGAAPGEERRLIIRGRANLLEDAAAADDMERVRQLFDALERQQGLLEVLDSTKDADGVRLFIGSENSLFPLSGSSVIVAPYMNAERQVIGALGVIGPTRLNYARVIPMVDYTARMVGEVLGKHRQE